MLHDNTCKDVNLLLVYDSDAKVGVVYTANNHTFELPEIGFRPPYYCNPRCEPYYTII